MAFSLWSVIKGLLVQDETDKTKQFSVEVHPSSTTGTKTTLVANQTGNRVVTLPDATGVLITSSTTDVLTNKTIDADLNTISNIDDGNIKTGAAIDASKLADGSVSNAEFQRLDGVTSNIQTQLNSGSSALSAHLSDPTDAHTASAITNVPSGNLTSTDVQSALNELQTSIDGVSATSGLNVGAGSQVFKDKVGDDLRFRTLVQGSNITITQNANDITIAGASAGANVTLSNLTSPTDINQDLTFDNGADRKVIIESQASSGAGKKLTVQAGGANGTNQAGGNLEVSSGSSTGSSNSSINFMTAPSGQASGSTVRNPATMATMFATVDESQIKVAAPLNGTHNILLSSITTGIKVYGDPINSVSTALPMSVESTANNGTGGTGSLIVRSAPSSTGSSTGTVQVRSGDNTSTGQSGAVTVGSGGSTSSSSGSLTLSTGDAPSSAAGNISVSPGTGVINGSINLNGKQVNLNSPLVESVLTYASYSTSPTNQLAVTGHPAIKLQSTTTIIVNGIAAGVEGQRLTLYNENNNNISFTNESGSATTSNDRIITCTGATVTSVGTSSHEFIYLSNRWVLINSEAAATTFVNSYRSATSTDTATTADDTIEYSGSSFTATIFTAVGNTGKILTLKHGGSTVPGSNVYALATTGGQTIGGVASGDYQLQTNGETLKIQSNGTNWIILEHKTETGWIDLGTLINFYTFTITSGSATIGATYTNNGNTYTVAKTVASGLSVIMSGPANPTTSGTLTKAAGAGDATLTFSAFSGSANTFFSTGTTPVFFGSPTTNKLLGKRRGNEFTLRGRFFQVTGGPVTGTGDWKFPMPANLIIDTTNHPVSTGGSAQSGQVETANIENLVPSQVSGYASYGANYMGDLNLVSVYSSTSFRLYGAQTGSMSAFPMGALTGANNTNLGFAFEVTLPISQWQP